MNTIKTASQNKGLEIVGLWVDGVNNLQIESLLRLYADDFALLPTFAPELITDKTSLKSYFQGLGERPQLRVELDEPSVLCAEAGHKSFAIGGYYSFQFEFDGALKHFPCRFSYIVDLDKTGPIVHHHSSLVPNNL